MTHRAKLALALWAVFAIVVFNVTFDWQTRMAGVAFLESQHVRRAQGLPLATIAAGFRPLVVDAAGRASMWLLVVLAIGTSGIAFSSRSR